MSVIGILGNKYCIPFTIRHYLINNHKTEIQKEKYKMFIINIIIILTKLQ